MRSIEDIRRNNLIWLEQSFGSLKSLADALERSESQVSQWKNGAANSGTGKPRGMRSDSARYIEQKTGRPAGWMDADHSSSDAGEPIAHRTARLLTLEALEMLGELVNNLPPLVQSAGRDALKKWAQGEASNAETEAVLRALTAAGAKLPPLGEALINTPVKHPTTNP